MVGEWWIKWVLVERWIKWVLVDRRCIIWVLQRALVNGLCNDCVLVNKRCIQRLFVIEFLRFVAGFMVSM